MFFYLSQNFSTPGMLPLSRRYLQKSLYLFYWMHSINLIQWLFRFLHLCILLQLFRLLKCSFFMKSYIPAYLDISLAWNINLVGLGCFTVPNKNSFLPKRLHLSSLLFRHMYIKWTSENPQVSHFWVFVSECFFWSLFPRNNMRNFILNINRSARGFCP
jgi:hypothetical protein